VAESGNPRRLGGRCRAERRGRGRVRHGRCRRHERRSQGQREDQRASNCGPRGAPTLFELCLFSLGQSAFGKRNLTPIEGVGGAPMCPNLEPNRAGSRHRCRSVPLAAARRAGGASGRYFLRLDRSSNPRVGGRERRCASRSLRSHRLLANPSDLLHWFQCRWNSRTPARNLAAKRGIGCGKSHRERNWVWKIPQGADSGSWVVSHMANIPRFRGILLQGSPTAGMRRGEMSRFMLAHRPFS
jgi:hypothetical protein